MTVFAIESDGVFALCYARRELKFVPVAVLFRRRKNFVDFDVDAANFFETRPNERFFDLKLLFILYVLELTAAALVKNGANGR